MKTVECRQCITVKCYAEFKQKKETSVPAFEPIFPFLFKIQKFSPQSEIRTAAAPAVYITMVAMDKAMVAILITMDKYDI